MTRLATWLAASCVLLGLGTQCASGESAVRSPAAAEPVVPSPRVAGRAAARIFGSEPAAAAAALETKDTAQAVSESRPALRLRFVGDIIFGRYREGRFSPLLQPGGDPFRDVLQLLEGDWVVANLETPLVSALPTRDHRPGFFFGGTQEMARTLADAGFHAVSLANNHAADLGLPGLRETPRLVRELGLQPLGAAREPGEARWLESIEVRGVRLGVVAVTTRMNFETPASYPQVNIVREDQLAETLGPVIAQATLDHDLVVVLVHWGVEYSRYPEQVQRRAARSLVASGADLVIGHHPHVLQEIELYQGGVIAYSLGNFLFENTAPEPRLTGVLGLDLDRATMCDIRVHFEPAVLRRVPDFHPEPAVGPLAEKARLRIPPRAVAQRASWSREGEAIVARQRRTRCGVRP